MTRQVYNSVDLFSVLEEALEKNGKPLHVIAQRAGLSSSIVSSIRTRGNANMTTDTVFALAKVLGLTITVEGKKPKPKAAAPAKPASVIEDIKVVQNWGWVSVDGDSHWAPKEWTLVILRDGKWAPVPIEHKNLKRPKE